MNPSPSESTAPDQSQIQALLPGAYFHDAWAIEAAEPGLDALGQFLRVATRTPKWIELLMGARNGIVQFFGLKNLGGLSQIDAAKTSAQYLPGDRVGIFTLLSRSDDEVLLGDRDKHLNVVVSVHKSSPELNGSARVTVTTVVHVKNWLGRLYMLPVKPAHRVITRTMVRAVGDAV